MLNDKLKEYTLLAALLIAVFGVYLHTAFPAFKGNDSPETAAAAYTLGIQHAPGYPIYTMLGRIAVSLNLANPAFKVNLLSAFLAVLTLLVTYVILTRHVFKLFGIERGVFTWAMGYGLLSILAFSNVFWNQAIEAKGGIYMLNLLFLAILIYLFLEQARVPAAVDIAGSPDVELENRNPKPGTKIKNLYLIAYIYGLSLANHWPSMIILLPLFAVIFYKYGKSFTGPMAARAALVFCAGLSAYMYLYVRAGTNPALNWGNPSTLGALIDLVSRKMYAGQGMPFTGFVIGYQVKYLLEALSSNYMFLWILALPGMYAVYKKQSQLFWLLSSTALITAALLVLYNRTALETIWLMGIFLLPVQYIMFIFIASGAAFAAGLMKSRWQKGLAAAAVAVLAAALLNLNLEKNNRACDYISYDIMYNILNSTAPGAYYLSEHDMYLLPMLYEKNVEKHRTDLKIFSLPFLLNDWGVKQARDIFGYFPSKTGDILYNLAGIVGLAIQGPGVIYRDFSSPAFDALNLPLFQGYFGLIKRVSAGLSAESPRIYELYSYRGMYSAFAQSDENIEIVTRYLIFMSMHAERLMQLLRYKEAISTYEKALLIPAEKLAYNIYYNMAQCYMGLGERQNAMAFLKKTIDDKKDFLPAYEAAGRLYYGENDIYNAGKYFTQALMLGSTDKKIKELEAAARVTITQNEAEIAEAERLALDKQYAKALNILSALVKLEYRAADVYLRMGQLYYEQGDKDRALAMLINSNKKEMSPGAFFYQAKIYWEKGMADKAKAAALEGLTRFKDDKRLQKLYSKLKGI